MAKYEIVKDRDNDLKICYMARGAGGSFIPSTWAREPEECESLLREFLSTNSKFPEVVKTVEIDE